MHRSACTHGRTGPGGAGGRGGTAVANWEYINDFPSHGGLILLNTVLKKGRTPIFSSARKARRSFSFGEKISVRSVRQAEKSVSGVSEVSPKNYYKSCL